MSPLGVVFGRIARAGGPTALAWTVLTVSVATIFAALGSEPLDRYSLLGLGFVNALLVLLSRFAWGSWRRWRTGAPTPPADPAPQDPADGGLT